MKLTTEQLRNIIKQELKEGFDPYAVPEPKDTDVGQEIIKMYKDINNRLEREEHAKAKIDALEKIRSRYDDSLGSDGLPSREISMIDQELEFQKMKLREQVKHLSTIISEELEAVLDEKKGSKRQRKKKAKKKKASDRCTRIAKRKYDVWPSAYASGAVVQCRRGKIWKGLKEEDAHPEVDEMINEEELTDEEMAMFRKILQDKGGAAGPGDITAKIDKPISAINKAIKADDKIKKHKHGDIYTDEPIKEQEELEEAVYAGRTVKLNKPMRGDVKKFKVYVNSGKKDKQGRIKAKKVNFGHGGTSAKKKGEKTMKIRKNNPKARKNFRARHNCDNPGPKTKARYWSCRKW